MSQTISVSVQMTPKNFRDFRVFDVFRHQKAWKRPLIFAVILLTSAVICLSQVGKREGALLLTVVLTVVALGLPGVYFGTFFHQLSQIIKKMKLPQPFYRVELSGDGVAVWLAGEQDKPAPTYQYPWADVLCAYRTADAIYLYVAAADEKAPGASAPWLTCWTRIWTAYGSCWAACPQTSAGTAGNNGRNQWPLNSPFWTGCSSSPIL